MRYFYATFSRLLDHVAPTLNELEARASGMYEIVSITESHQGYWVIVVRISLRQDDGDPPFDEEEIKRRLGFK